MAKIELNDYLEKLTEPEDRETVANRAYQRELFEQYVTKDGNFPEQRAPVSYTHLTLPTTVLV